MVAFTQRLDEVYWNFSLKLPFDELHQKQNVVTGTGDWTFETTKMNYSSDMTFFSHVRNNSPKEKRLSIFEFARLLRFLNNFFDSTDKLYDWKAGCSARTAFASFGTFWVAQDTTFFWKAFAELLIGLSCWIQKCCHESENYLGLEW